MIEDAFEKLKAFVIRHRGKYRFPLERTTTIMTNLGIDGDDAYDFIVAYGEKFQVDITNFMLSNYFNSEGFGFFTAVTDPRPKKKLTLGDLEKGILAGKLNEEIIIGIAKGQQ